MPDKQVTELLHEFPERATRMRSIASHPPEDAAELHKLADAYLRRERPEHTLQPTALVNEAYLRLVAHKPSPITAAAPTSTASPLK